MAAGITIAPDQVDNFINAFEQHVSNKFPSGLPEIGTDYDASVGVPDLCENFFSELLLLEPFGQQNPAPLLRLNKVTFVTKPSLFGKTGEHLRGAITGSGGGIKQLLAWSVKKEYPDLSRSGSSFNVIIKPQLNRWRGEAIPQLLFVDGETC